MVTEVLDVTGLKCPLPILRAKKALAKLDQGAILTVLATDKGAPVDFAAFCQQTGHILISSKTLEDQVFEMIIKHK